MGIVSPSPAAEDRGTSDLADTVDDDPFRRLNLQAWHRNRRRAQRLAEMVVDLGGGLSAETEPPEGRQEAARSLAHEIVGSAGTFGYPGASVLARQFEELLTRAPDLSEATLAELTALAGRLEQALAHEPSIDGRE